MLKMYGLFERNFLKISEDFLRFVLFLIIFSRSESSESECLTFSALQAHMVSKITNFEALSVQYVLKHVFLYVF